MSNSRPVLKQIAKLKQAIIGTRPARDKAFTLREAIVAVLADRKMTTTEITVGVVEKGYKSEMPKRLLHNYVRKLMRKDDRFKRDGDKWTTWVG